MELYNYIEGITKDPNNRIMLALGNGTVVSGFIDSELTFGASAQYGAMSESSALDSLSSGVQQLGELFGQAVTLKFPWMTKKSWTGSSVNDISFSIYKLATDVGEDLLSQTKAIWTSTLPSTNGQGLTGTYKPPNGYNAGGYLDGRKSDEAGKSNKPIGAITLKIGKWFESYGYIITSANMIVSKEKIDAGKTLPLYIKLDITLSRSMDATGADFTSWFTAMK